jgi:acyl carrier protein
MDGKHIVRQFLLAEFLPDVPAAEVADDTDLLATGVIDSLGLLKVIAWLEDRFGISSEDLDLELSAFRSIDAISELVSRAGARAG